MPHLTCRRLAPAIALALAAILIAPAGVFAQKLQKTLERKFPSEYCPLDTPFLGTFQSETGIVRLTFTTNNGHDDGSFTFFENKLDDVMIVLASEFNANSELHPFCYLGSLVPVYTGNPLQGGAAVPLFDTFSPSTSPCPWDVLNGATIDAGGFIALGTEALGVANVSTSVVVSGLTPNIDYVVHGNWSASGFLDTPLCVPGSVCMEVRVDDVTQGCGPLPTEESTWGRIKSLYR